MCIKLRRLMEAYAKLTRRLICMHLCTVVVVDRREPSDAVPTPTHRWSAKYLDGIHFLVCHCTVVGYVCAHVRLPF